ncbi:unnamed protein product [Thlaspi arvense]|uniref:pectinesterase n=1 Tax=Thlaspi arvense TaxID=13288 RepID=A0AAU9RL80_THLAR|nr:unnamed protein product [Thlaspi arvense]
MNIKCKIYVKGVTSNVRVNEGEMLSGFITAQGRKTEQDTSGFVFKYCVIEGDGKTSLGRAYRGYSRVVFYRTRMSNIVNCTGEGANKQGRVGWEKNLSAKDIASLVNTKTFIDQDGWMATLPTSLASLYSPSLIC